MNLPMDDLRRRAAPPEPERRAVRAASTLSLAVVLITGCAGTTAVIAESEPREPPPAPAASPAPAAPPATPVPAAAPEASMLERDPELYKELMYEVLVAELAGRRGRLDLALSGYLDVARRSRDPAAAERAVRIAVFARDTERGIEAARLWTEIAPESDDAQQVYAALLLRAGRIDEAVPVLAGLVARLEARSPGRGFARIGELLAREKNKAASLQVMERLVGGHEDDPVAQYAYGQLLARSGELDRARTVFERVLELDPDNDRATVVHARILQRQGETEAALEHLRAAVERRPDSEVVRTTYARLLVDAKRYEEAREQFELLAERSPGNADVRYALGLLLLQTNRLDEAAEQFEALLERGQRRYASTYYLAQIAESRKDYERALDLYRKVDRGEHRLNAQIRAAVLLAEQGDVDGARSHLQNLRAGNSQEAVRIFRAEAEILARRDRLDEAMEVYDAALREYPHDTDLLYARAMLAEKLDRLDVLERDLREILSREPDNADALNALGYTLADRTDRLDEAYEFIKRAYELKPDDHYIVDSMGWVLYRMGRHQEALEHLRRAMELNPDPEIAAHLGEVLWVTGKKAEAKEVWDAALQTTPEDKRLLEVKRRFGL